MNEDKKQRDITIADDSVSTTSDAVSINTLSQEHELHNFCKQTLKNRMFVGHYQERRYVNSLSTYRDLVVIRDSEFDLKKDLDSVKGRLDHFYSNSMWVGCTGPHSGSYSADHALWVKLHDVPFGHYWFRIKQIIFGDREIRARVQVIRPLEMSDTAIPRHVKATMSTSKLDRTGSTTSSRLTPSRDSLENDWSDSVPTLEKCAYSVAAWKDAFLERAAYFLVTVVTYHNAKESCRFLFVLAMAVITGLVHLIQYLGDFTIKFLREFSVVVKASTPIALGVIDFFTKMVGGFYILVAMMWKGQNNRPSTAEFGQPPYIMQRPLQIQSSYSRPNTR